MTLEIVKFHNNGNVCFIVKYHKNIMYPPAFMTHYEFNHVYYMLSDVRYNSIHETVIAFKITGYSFVQQLVQVKRKEPSNFFFIQFASAYLLCSSVNTDVTSQTLLLQQWDAMNKTSKGSNFMG